MKDKLIYVMILLIAFFIVTAAVYYGASNYRNIFAFDFTSVTSDSILIKSAESGVTENNKKEADKGTVFADTAKSTHVTNKTIQNEADIKISASSVMDSSLIILEELKKIKELLEQKNQVVSVQNPQPDLSKKNSMKDSVYSKWIKSSVKLYEAMDSKKAAKIIQGFNDNIARDIIFSMKKKKAAEIIAEFKPELANRIISIE
jgi:flagellar motility protein MotE (MotC chaperone)